MSLHDDWKTYLSDPNSFDDSHFEMLLFEDELYKSPERLFEVLPDAKVLLQRLGRLTDEWKFTGLYFVASGKADQATQVARIDKYRYQLADLGADEGLAEDAALLRQAPILPTYDRSVFEAMSKDRNLLRSEIPDLIDDLTLELMANRDGRLLGAYEAILQLTKRPEITNWVLAKSMSLPMDLEPAFLFYRDGGKMLLASDAIHLLLPAD